MFSRCYPIHICQTYSAREMGPFGNLNQVWHRLFYPYTGQLLTVYSESGGGPSTSHLLPRSFSRSHSKSAIHAIHCSFSLSSTWFLFFDTPYLTYHYIYLLILCQRILTTEPHKSCPLHLITKLLFEKKDGHGNTGMMHAPLSPCYTYPSHYNPIGFGGSIIQLRESGHRRIYYYSSEIRSKNCFNVSDNTSGRASTSRSTT